MDNNQEISTSVDNSSELLGYKPVKQPSSDEAYTAKCTHSGSEKSIRRPEPAREL